MNGRLRVVRDWNTAFSFELISKIYAQNVVYWPLDIRNRALTSLPFTAAACMSRPLAIDR